MPLDIDRSVSIACPVTGPGAARGRSPHVPRGPTGIVHGAIEAVRAGAAVVHRHVPDPDTGTPSRGIDPFREPTERIREADTGVAPFLGAGTGDELGVGPGIEAFDTGHPWFARELARDGTRRTPALVRLRRGGPGARGGTTPKFVPARWPDGYADRSGGARHERRGSRPSRSTSRPADLRAKRGTSIVSNGRYPATSRFHHRGRTQ